jgi:toxin ParE1/3/4
MARKVVWTETAWRDLERSADYIAENSPGYAAAFVRNIRENARSLDVLTLRGRMVPELGESKVREILIGNYRLIYEVHERTIYGDKLERRRQCEQLSGAWRGGDRR